MIDTFTVFDVETANRSRGSVCSIGVVHIENGVNVFSREYLINPEMHFDYFNIQVHHITPEDVAYAPFFYDVWKEIKELFTEYTLVAHNAKSMDLNAICSDMERYGIRDCGIPYSYICTLEMARKHRCQSRFGCNKLDALCDGFGIELESHHNALSDALACKDLLYALDSEYGLQNNDIKEYRYTTFYY